MIFIKNSKNSERKSIFHKYLQYLYLKFEILDFKFLLTFLAPLPEEGLIQITNETPERQARKQVTYPQIATKLISIEKIEKEVEKGNRSWKGKNKQAVEGMG